MNSYSVKQVASMLGKDEETVRRWIRAGKLVATQESKRSGNVITATALKDFVNKMPKYAPAVATSMALSSSAVSILVAGLLGGLAAVLARKKTLTEADVEEFLDKKIETHQKAIKEKKQAIEKLQNELAEEEKNLEKYQYARTNLDLKLLAEEINSERS